MNKDMLKAIEEKLGNLHMTLHSLNQMPGQLSDEAMKNLSEILDEILSDVEGELNK